MERLLLFAKQKRSCGNSDGLPRIASLQSATSAREQPIFICRYARVVCYYPKMLALTTQIKHEANVFGFFSTIKSLRRFRYEKHRNNVGSSARAMEQRYSIKTHQQTFAVTKIYINQRGIQVLCIEDHCWVLYFWHLDRNWFTLHLQPNNWHTLMVWDREHNVPSDSFPQRCNYY